MCTSRGRSAMPKNATIKNFENTHSYLHVQYFQDVCIDEVAESMLSYADGYSREYHTLILSDWTQVDHINFQKDDLYSLASLSSLWDLNKHKVCVALVTGQNDEISRMAKQFTSLIDNPEVVMKHFGDTSPATQWLHTFTAQPLR